jgi:hypothetical protein
MTKKTLTDSELAEKVTKYLSEHTDITRRDVIEKCRTSIVRLKKLMKLGLIPGIPEPLTRSMAATRGRKVSPWGRFKLPGSPNHEHDCI